MECKVMADHRGSSSVTNLILVLVIILAGVGVWYYMTHGGMGSKTETTKLEVTLPSVTTTTEQN